MNVIQSLRLKPQQDFKLKVYQCVEHEHPSIILSMENTGVDHSDTIKAIEDGDLEWFCARVEVSLFGCDLAHTTLGACCYSNFKEFLESESLQQMIDEAIEEARETGAKLIEKLTQIINHRPAPRK